MRRTCIHCGAVVTTVMNKLIHWHSRKPGCDVGGTVAEAAPLPCRVFVFTSAGPGMTSSSAVCDCGWERRRVSRQEAEQAAAEHRRSTGGEAA